MPVIICTLGSSQQIIFRSQQMSLCSIYLVPEHRYYDINVLLFLFYSGPLGVKYVGPGRKSPCHGREQTERISALVPCIFGKIHFT